MAPDVCQEHDLRARARRRVYHGISVLLFYSVLFTVFFSPVLLRRRLLAPGDGQSFFIPAFFATPTLWTPLLFAGFPVAAEPQMQTFYPVARFFALFGAWNAFVLSAYVMAACFMHGYVYRLTRSLVASLAAGIVYSMSGFFMAHLGHISMIHAAAWLPLVLWALEEMRHMRSTAWLLVGALAIASSALAGHPQMLLYGLGVGAAYVVVLSGSAATGSWYPRASLIAASIGLSLAAVQIVPTVELWRLSPRLHMGFREFVSFALPGSESVRLLFPHIFGSPVLGLYKGPYFGSWNVSETSGYVGMLPLAAALVGIAARRRDAVTWFWTGVAILSVHLALGDATPLAAIMYLVPGYHWFRCPARHFVETALAVATLAGLGIAAMQRQVEDVGRHAKRAAWALVALAVSGVLVIVLRRRQLRAAAAAVGVVHFRLAPWNNAAVGIPLLVAVLSVAVILWYAKRANSTVRSAVLLAGVVLDLASFGWFLEWRTLSADCGILEPPVVLRRYQERVGAGDFRVISFEGNVGPAETAIPNLNWLWRIPNAAGYTPLVLRRHSQAVPWADNQSLQPENRVLDILATRYLLMPRSQTGLESGVANPNLTNAGRWRHVEDIGEASVYENLRAMPRAWTVSRLATLEPDAILTTLRTSRMPDGGSFDPGAVALVEEPVSVGSPAGDPHASVSVLKIADTEVAMNVRTSANVFLVLSDVNYPGWRAAIDGRNTRLYQTDYLLRGVAVPAGEHVVTFAFRPYSLYIGLGISLCSIIAMIAVGLRG